jgi:hypothetical protein
MEFVDYRNRSRRDASIECGPPDTLMKEYTSPKEYNLLFRNVGSYREEVVRRNAKGASHESRRRRLLGFSSGCRSSNIKSLPD